MERYDSALFYHREAATHALLFGDTASWSLALGGEGIVYDRMGRKDSAEYYFKQELRTGRYTGLPETIIRGLDHLGQFYWQNKENEKAEKLLKEAMDLAVKQNDPVLVEAAGKLLWGFYEESGQPGRAFPVYRKYMAARDSINSKAQN